MADKTDEVLGTMEDDVRKMAQSIRPSVSMVPGTVVARMPQVRDKVTVSHLAKALDQLTGEMRQAADAAWTQATKLTGAKDEAANDVIGNAKDRPIFEGLAQQVMDCSVQLARLQQAQAAIERALS
jgi:hypothetical protein